MILEILVGVQAGALVVGVPLLRHYLRERVANLAREQTERALDDYRHEHARALAAVNATYQKGVHEFGLYAQKQHQVYAGLYRRVREASDRYGWFYRLTMGPDFSRFAVEDVEGYRVVHDLRDRDVDDIKRLAALRNEDALRKAMNSLDQKVHARDAEQVFQKAKNIEALNELYLSDGVRKAMDEVRRTMGAVAVAARRDPDDRDDKGVERNDALQAAVAALYKAMRSELKRGVEPA